ncbi:MAG: hypothetical protein ACTSVK_18175 [Promethearchaeota archaeon]
MVNENIDLNNKYRFKIGFDIKTNEKVFIDFSNAMKGYNILILGGMGSGKTVLSKALIELAAIKGIPSIVISEKEDIANLALINDIENDFSTELKSEIKSFKEKVIPIIFTPSSSKAVPIKFNPLEFPPNNLDDADVSSALDSMVKNFLQFIKVKIDTKDGTKLYNFLIYLFKIYWKEKREPKNLTEFLNEIRNRSGYVGQHYKIFKISETLMTSLEDKILRLKNELYSSTAAVLDLDKLLAPKIVNGKKKTPIIIILLSTLQNKESKELFVSAIFQNVYNWMLRQGRGKLRLFVCLDESFSYVPATGRVPVSKEMIMKLIRTDRAYGVGCILITQSFSGRYGIDKDVHNNTNLTILGSFDPMADPEIKPIIQDYINALHFPETTNSILDKIHSQNPGDFYLFSFELFQNQIPHIHVKKIITNHNRPLLLDNLAQEFNIDEWKSILQDLFTDETDSLIEYALERHFIPPPEDLPHKYIDIFSPIDRSFIYDFLKNNIKNFKIPKSNFKSQTVLYPILFQFGKLSLKVQIPIKNIDLNNFNLIDEYETQEFTVKIPSYQFLSYKYINSIKNVDHDSIIPDLINFNPNLLFESFSVLDLIKIINQYECNKPHPTPIEIPIQLHLEPKGKNPFKIIKKPYLINSTKLQLGPKVYDFVKDKITFIISNPTFRKTISKLQKIILDLETTLNSKNTELKNLENQLESLISIKNNKEIELNKYKNEKINVEAKRDVLKAKKIDDPVILIHIDKLNTIIEVLIKKIYELENNERNIITQINNLKSEISNLNTQIINNNQILNNLNSFENYLINDKLNFELNFDDIDKNKIIIEDEFITWIPLEILKITYNNNTYFFIINKYDSKRIFGLCHICSTLCYPKFCNKCHKITCDNCSIKLKKKKLIICNDCRR